MKFLNQVRTHVHLRNLRDTKLGWREIHPSTNRFKKQMLWFKRLRSYGYNIFRQEPYQKTMDDENNPRIHHNRQIDPNQGKSDDLKIIVKWTRKYLFPNVQFIYNHRKTCRIGRLEGGTDGYIYGRFKSELKNLMVGIKLLQGRSEMEKTQYIEELWKDIWIKKSNIITDGLNARRAAIYSAMQNRFVGKSFLTRMRRSTLNSQFSLFP